MPEDIRTPEQEPRRISDRRELEPRTRELCTALLERAEAAGIPTILIETVRFTPRQLWLYAQGRTRPGSIVTNAKPGETWHDQGIRRAFDVVLLDAAGKAWWNAPAERWERLGAIGKSLGLTWGGDFKGLRDLGHFQLDRVTLAEAKEIAKVGELRAALSGVSIELAAVTRLLNEAQELASLEDGA